MIAVCNNLLSSACPDLDTDCELVWAKIELLGARNQQVGAYYRPPSANNTLLGRSTVFTVMNITAYINLDIDDQNII